MKFLIRFRTFLPLITLFFLGSAFLFPIHALHAQAPDMGMAMEEQTDACEQDCQARRTACLEHCLRQSSADRVISITSPAVFFLSAPAGSETIGKHPRKENTAPPRFDKTTPPYHQRTVEKRE